ncbi:hypothetical protein SMICM304S_06129 [Streptomyces microflavus]
MRHPGPTSRASPSPRRPPTPSATPTDGQGQGEEPGQDDGATPKPTESGTAPEDPAAGEKPADKPSATPTPTKSKNPLDRLAAGGDGPRIRLGPGGRRGEARGEASVAEPRAEAGPGPCSPEVRDLAGRTGPANRPGCGASCRAPAAGGHWRAVPPRRRRRSLSIVLTVVDRVRAQRRRLGGRRRAPRPVRAVQDRVAPRRRTPRPRVRPRVGDHRLHHLGRPAITGLALRRHSSIERRFCTIGTFSSGYSTQVATGHHHTVERHDDALHVLDRLGLLHLGDDGDPAALLVHHLVHVLDVVGVPDEGEGDQVAAHPQGEAQVLDVLLGEGRDVHRRAGQVDALVVGDDTALDDDGLDPGVDGPR